MLSNMAASSEPVMGSRASTKMVSSPAIVPATSARRDRSRWPDNGQHPVVCAELPDSRSHRFRPKGHRVAATADRYRRIRPARGCRPGNDVRPDTTVRGPEFHSAELSRSRDSVPRPRCLRRPATTRARPGFAPSASTVKPRSAPGGRPGSRARHRAGLPSCWVSWLFQQPYQQRLLSVQPILGLVPERHCAGRR